MSAKIPLCLIAAACLTAVNPVSAKTSYDQFAVSKYLELSNFEDEIDEHGLAVFSGKIRSKHTARYIRLIQIRLIIKKNGLVVGTEEFGIDDLGPLEVGSFSYESYYTPEDYDEFYMLVSLGLISGVKRDLIVGEVYLVEESFNVVKGAIYGEIHNNTNANIRGVDFKFTFFDVRGDRLFTVVTTNLLRDDYDLGHVEILAGGISGFHIRIDEDFPYDKIKSKEVEIGWGVVDIVDIPSIATTVDAASWGEIKAMGR